MQEARDFAAAFRRQETSEGKIDLLAEVRSLELEDYALINNLLIEEAVHGNEEVRESAYTALREYGGERAAEALDNYLAFDRAIGEEDPAKLERIVAVVPPDQSATVSVRSVRLSVEWRRQFAALLAITPGV